MVDKMHRNWKWRLWMGAAVAAATVAAGVTMGAGAAFGGYLGCGSEWEPDARGVCADGFTTAAFGAVALFGLGVVATGVAWVARGRGGEQFAWSIVAGLGFAASVAFVFATGAR